MNSNNISLCIPRVFPNIAWKRVKEVFEELGFGKVERVDMVNKSNEKGEKFKRVFIHFKHWNKNKTVDAVKAKLESGDFVKVVYDDPWFWKVFKSEAPKPVFEKKMKPKTHKKGRPAPRLADDEHPGSPTPVAASASKELQELKAMMAAQQAEMALLREQLMMEKGMIAPESPPYGPCYSPNTPPYSPKTTTDEDLKVPELKRQQALGRDDDSDDDQEEGEVEK